jgi:hypothetical protein
LRPFLFFCVEAAASFQLAAKQGLRASGLHWLAGNNVNERKKAMTGSFEKKAFSAQMRNYFGFRPGEGLKEFAAELRALSHDDKVAFAEMLNEVGFPCEPPSAVATAA